MLHWLKACFKYTLKQMLIIGIAGGTGSGKTTVVRKIMESLPAGEVVFPQDSYYKDSSHVPVEERRISTLTIRTLLSGVFFPDMSPCCAKEKA